ncbi:MAG: L,D-transpeptidase family protein [Pseudomonadota bacterium]
MLKKRMIGALVGALMAATGTHSAADVQNTVENPVAATSVAAGGHVSVHRIDLEVGPLTLMPPQVLAQVPPTGKAILVNIPSFELIAFEERVPVMRSRVVVGSPRTPTPVMLTETSVVRFRPTWTPTPSMIKEGIKPGTRPAGPKNPLGYLAIRLEPGMLIYLHGTNKPHLYERDMRALSHGCVRVEQWAEVAAWVLGTDVADVNGHAHGRRTFDMQTSGVPVIVTYMTEFPDADGVMRSWPDVYGRGTYAGLPPANVN